MARNKELTVVLLDAGQYMEPHLQLAARAVSSFAFTKILTKPAHEVALILFGTTETVNPVHDELANSAEDPDDTQYLHIHLKHSLQPPTLDFVRTLSQLQLGNGRSDWADALAVAVDTLKRAVEARPELAKKNVVKRIVLISNLLSQAQVSGSDDPLVQAMVAYLQGEGARFELMTIDIPEHDSAPGVVAAKRFNMDVLASLMAEVEHRHRSVRNTADLPGVFKAREYAHTAYYTGPLTISDSMNIRVKLCKKGMQERLPSFPRYSERSIAPGALHTVTRDTEFKQVANPDEVVPAEERVKAYRYGKQNVPLSGETEKAVKYTPAKGMHLVGFVQQHLIPRYSLMKDPYIIVPEKENEKAITAMSALVRAMHQSGQAAIVRCVLRAESQVLLGYATPVLGNLHQPDSLILNVLPFAEDVRQYQFASFNSKEDLVPSAQQLQAVQKLLAAMDLTAGGHEHLVPETTVNPQMHRVLDYLARRMVDSDAVIPESDILADRTLDANLTELSHASAAVSSMTEVFNIRQLVPVAAATGYDGQQPAAPADNGGAGEAQTALFSLTGAAATNVEAVGTSTPVEDFNAMVAQGRVDDAFAGLQQACRTLVDTSLGDRFYEKALRCVNVLRSASIQHSRSGFFNNLLHSLCDTYEHHRQHGDFWRLLASMSIKQITSDEAPDSTVTVEEADRFYNEHNPAAQVKAEEAGAAPLEEEDEFADMD